MPRAKRRKSVRGIYHIMIRGNEKWDLFTDDEDRIKFIQTVSTKAKDGEYAGEW